MNKAERRRREAKKHYYAAVIAPKLKTVKPEAPPRPNWPLLAGLAFVFNMVAPWLWYMNKAFWSQDITPATPQSTLIFTAFMTAFCTLFIYIPFIYSWIKWNAWNRNKRTAPNQ